MNKSYSEVGTSPGIEPTLLGRVTNVRRDLLKVQELLMCTLAGLPPGNKEPEELCGLEVILIDAETRSCNLVHFVEVLVAKIGRL